MPKLKNPAYFSGLVSALVMIATQIPAFHLSIEAGAAVTAFVAAGLAFYTAFVVHQTTLALGTGVAQATFVLLAAFKLDTSPGLQTAIVAAIPFALSLFQHTQTIPLDAEQPASLDLST